MKKNDYHEIPRAVPVQPMKRPFPLISGLAGALPAVRASDGFAERLLPCSFQLSETAGFRCAIGTGVAIARYARRISRKMRFEKIRFLNKILAKNRLFCYMGQNSPISPYIKIPVKIK